MHYLYILKSKNSGRYYIGETNNIENRLALHRAQRTAFGKRNSDLDLVYRLQLPNRNEAKRVEYFLKRQKSHLFIDKLITGKVNIPR